MSSRPARGAARLAAILDALPDALLLVNGNGTVVNANAIALETLQGPGTPLVGRGLLDIIPDFDPRRIPGSMRRPDADPTVRTKPTRMVARRTDGVELPVEVTSAGLNSGHTPYAYASSIEAAFADDYSGEELLMLVVRDLSGTLDTEAELVRQQRQTEMILRAASEGVVGVDTAGRIVLVNPAAAQILGHRASQLGGQELHPLIQHSRADGTPLAFEETPLHDTLTSGRKHRVRGQVLWTKEGRAVPVDVTTAPVRDGDQLVGAVLTFTDRRPYDALAARHAQLMSVLGDGLRGPLRQLGGELSALAADSAGQLWPEANQVLHHLAAGYTRMTTLLDNVLSFQRLDDGREKLQRQLIALDEVVSAGVDGATELIGPGRAQFAVHAPQIEVEVDPARMAQALAHLVADVAGVDATGRQAGAGAPAGDSTIVVAAAQRGEVVRIEVRGPYPGGDPVHEPIVRGIVRQHGGVLQTHEVPGPGGGATAYVLEVPVSANGAGAGPATSQARDATGDTTVMPVPAEPARGTQPEEPGQTEAQGQALAVREPAAAIEPAAGGPSGRRRRQAPPAQQGQQGQPEQALEQGHVKRHDAPAAGGEGGGGRRRRALAPAGGVAVPDQAAAERQAPPTGRRRRQAQHAQHAQPAAPRETPGQAGQGERERIAIGPPSGPGPQQQTAGGDPTGAAALEPAVAQPPVPSLPAPPQAPVPVPAPESEPRAAQPVAAPDGSQDAAAEDAAAEGAAGAESAEGAEGEPQPVEHSVVAASPILDGSAPHTPALRQPRALPMPGSERNTPDPRSLPGVSVQTLGQGVPVARSPQQSMAQRPMPPRVPTPAPAPRPPAPAAAQPGQPGQTAQTAQPAKTAANAASPAHATSSTAVAQGAPSTAHPTPARRRKLAAPPAEDPRVATATAPAPSPAPSPSPSSSPSPSAPGVGGREYAIGAPAADAVEGPEPLDGPNGVVDVTDGHSQGQGLRLPGPAEDELPPEPLDNPRRLLVWPEPDVSTQQALTDRGYRPVIVHSREEVDAQIAAYPAALFVDPLTGPITRTALQSLRTAAVAAQVPVLVTAGLGQASREAAYGADPAVLLKALAPRDSEQHPPRVLLVEEQQAIADALKLSLERRGMQAAHAPTDVQAMELAQHVRPNLVVMDLNQVRRRRAGIIDWLRVNDLLNRTPFVVYTAAELDHGQLPLLASGETVLFLAERSTHPEVQARIVDLLTKIGAH